MRGLLVLFSAVFVYGATKRSYQSEDEPSDSKRSRQQIQTNEPDIQFYDGVLAQIGVKSYDETQRKIIVNNATDLYTDIMKCSLFCYRELISQILVEDRISAQLLDSIRVKNLEKRILKLFYRKLSDIEKHLNCFLYSNSSLDEQIPNVHSSINVKCAMDCLVLKTPVPLRRALHFQFGLLSAFGLRDIWAWDLHEILSDFMEEGDKQPVYDLMYSCATIIDDFCESFSLKFINNLVNKLKQVEQKQQPFTPFDRSNLMERGPDRLELAKVLLSYVSESANLREKHIQDSNLPATAETREKIINMLEKCAKFIQESSPESIYEIFLDENLLYEDNLQIFKYCQSKIRLILVNIVNYSLYLFQKEGLLLTELSPPEYLELRDEKFQSHAVNQIEMETI